MMIHIKTTPITPPKMLFTNSVMRVSSSGVCCDLDPVRGNNFTFQQ
jgi:hypothetical protein